MLIKKNAAFWFICWLLILNGFLLANITKVIYVSPNGNDLNNGTIDKPLASFKAAVEKVKALIAENQERLYRRTILLF